MLSNSQEYIILPDGQKFVCPVEGDEIYAGSRSHIVSDVVKTTHSNGAVTHYFYVDIEGVEETYIVAVNASMTNKELYFFNVNN